MLETINRCYNNVSNQLIIIVIIKVFGDTNIILEQNGMS